MTAYERPLRSLLVLGNVIAVGIIVWMLSSVIDRIHIITTTAILAVLLAYLLKPAVNLFERWGLGRLASSLAVYAIVLGLGVVVAFFSVPTIANQGRELARDMPGIVDRVKASMERPDDAVSESLPPNARRYIADHLGDLNGTTAEMLGDQMPRAMGVVKGTFGLALQGVVVVILAFFFLLDAERVRDTILRVVPERHEADARDMIDRFDDVIGCFVRGQLALSVGLGIVAVMFFEIIRLKYALLLGLAAGLATVIPIVGPIAGSLGPIAIGLATGGLAKAGVIAAGLLLLYEAQGHVFAPIIIGKSVGVSPLVIFFVVIAAGEANGIVGMLVAIPIAGMARVLFDRCCPKRAYAARVTRTEPEPVKGKARELAPAES